MSLSIPRAIAWLGMVLAGVALALILFEGGGGHPYVVYATFHDAGDLLPNSFVKIDGIQAGVVEAVSLNKAETEAVVRMGLDSDAAPIGRGASAEIRPVNLLGEKYVQLDPGDTAHPLPSGSSIPLIRTSDPVELDDIFNTLDPSTLTGLSVIVNEAGLAMAGRGADFMQTLRELPPTLSSAHQVVGEIAQQNAALERTIVSGNRVLASIDSRRGDLQSLVRSANGALEAINSSRGELGQTVTDAPGALGQLRRSLLQLQTAAGALTPAAANLQATAPALGATLARIPAFTAEAGGALSAAREVAPALARLGTRSAPILALIRPATETLASFAADLAPFLGVLDRQGGLREFLGFVAGWTGVTSQRDDLGHVFRLRFSLDDQPLTSALGKYGALLGLGPSARRRSPIRGLARAGLGTVAALVRPTGLSTGAAKHGTSTISPGAPPTPGTPSVHQLLQYLLGP